MRSALSPARAMALRPRLRVALLAAMGLLLTGLLARQGLSAWVDPVRPQVRTADVLSTLRPQSSQAELQSIADRMRQAINEGPLDSSAYAVLALAQGRLGHPQDAERLMVTANNLDRRDSVSDVWLAAEMGRQGRYDEAFSHVDALMRRKYGKEDVYGPLILATLKDPRAVDALGRRLAPSPSPEWRERFLDTAFRTLPQPEGNIAILNAIVHAGGTVNATELSPVLDGLTKSLHFQQAYLLWLLDSPKAVVENAGNLVNGDFGSTPSALPFNWTAWGGKFLISDASAFGHPGHALRIAFDDVDPPTVLGQQLVVLPQGDYRLMGDVMSIGASAGHVEWAVTCADSNRELAAIAAPQTGGGWTRFGLDFAVPEHCEAQFLQARSTRGGDGQSIEVWYDALSITRRGSGS